MQGKDVADAVKAVRGRAQGGHRPPPVQAAQKRVCFYCLDSGHLIVDYEAWKKKNQAKSKGVAFVKSVSNMHAESTKLSICMNLFC